MYPFPVRPPEPQYVSILKSATKLAAEGDIYEALGKLIQFCEHPENRDAEDRNRLAIEQVMDAITAYHDKSWNELRETLQALKKVPQRERRCPKRYRDGPPSWSTNSILPWYRCLSAHGMWAHACNCSLP